MLIKVSYDTSKIADFYSGKFSESGDLTETIKQKVMKDIVPYVPFKSGELQLSAKSKPGSGKITWSAPHARSVWYGKTSKGQPIQFDRSVNNLAGPRFTESYKANHINELKDIAVRGMNRR